MTAFTDKELARKVAEQIKITDTGPGSVRGHYASLSSSGTAFMLRYFDKVDKKQRTIEVGRFDAATFTRDHARERAGSWYYEAKNGVSLVRKYGGQRERAIEQQRAATVSFDAMCAAYIADLEAAGKEWKAVASRLQFARATFGASPASEVTAKQIAQLLSRLAAEGYAVNYINAVRNAISGAFTYGADIEREWAPFNPVSKLGKQAKGNVKERFLSPDEARTLWHGLDRPGCPGTRREHLALRLILCTMLRPGEAISPLSADVDRKTDPKEPALNTFNDKKSRPIRAPLGSLAMEVINDIEHLTDGASLFAAGPRGGALTVHALDRACAGLLRKNKNGKVIRREIGICEFLGMKAFTPHDLRRTGSMWLRLGGKPLGMAQLGIEYRLKAAVAICLDHQEEKASATDVYTTVDAYSASIMKRPMIDDLDRMLRTAIGKRPARTAKPGNVVQLLAA